MTIPYYILSVVPSLKHDENAENLISVITTTYAGEKFKFIITPPESFTSYEKLVMPFDKTTWIVLLVTFLIAFFIILMVNRLPKKRNVVYGVNVQMPGYNIVSVFFGIGQTQLPSTNFPRFILIFSSFFVSYFAPLIKVFSTNS